jgi:hypothetical protein
MYLQVENTNIIHLQMFQLGASLESSWKYSEAVQTQQSLLRGLIMTTIIRLFHHLFRECSNSLKDEE